ncbi:hypothetical protein LTR56_022060 [Elasticomyces elasticus]|nr:hypothetical protein LTR56_022060 [Elasticomyces elasticus]
MYPVRQNELANIDDDGDDYLQYQLGLIYGDGNYNTDRPGYMNGQRYGQYPAPPAQPPPDWRGLGEAIGNHILQGQPARGGNLHTHEEPQRQRRTGSERLTEILRGGRHVFGPARSEPQQSGGHRIDYHAQGPSNISCMFPTTRTPLAIATAAAITVDATVTLKAPRLGRPSIPSSSSRPDYCKSPSTRGNALVMIHEPTQTIARGKFGRSDTGENDFSQSSDESCGVVQRSKR